MKNIIIIVVVLLLAGAAIWYGTKMAEAPADLAMNTFTSQNEETIDVQFDNENQTAIMTGAGHEDLVFTQAVSASGARYENKENNLVLWNKGDQITLYEGDEIIFTGSTKPEEEQTSLQGSSWLWQHTELLNGEKMEAPEGEKFVLTFENDGRFGSKTDCNSLGGNYVMDSEVLSLGEIAMTKMYCEGSLDGEYANQLGLVNSHVIEGDTLRLNLNRDYGVMVFTKK